MKLVCQLPLFATRSVADKLIQIVHFLQNLDEWLKDEVVETMPPFENWSPIIRKQPKGLVLVLG